MHRKGSTERRYSAPSRTVQIALRLAVIVLTILLATYAAGNLAHLDKHRSAVDLSQGPVLLTDPPTGGDATTR